MGIDMVTIKDVARYADVSVATVSRVLNGQPNVKEESIQKIMAAVEDLHYRPNLAARNLRKSESGVIMVFIQQFSNPYYNDILSGICDASRQLDYSAHICSIENNPNQEDLLQQTIFQRRADGIIILACGQDDLWLKKYTDEIPIVFCSEYVESLKLPFVGIDNRAAAFSAVEQLIQLGHTKIGMISSQNAFVSTRLRFQGYCDALSAHGLTYRHDYVVHASTDYSFASGVDAAHSLLSQPERPSALFCISDRLALGAIEAARSLGLRVPEDLSVWGFDNIEYTHMLHPYVSTVSQPCYDMGYQAMQYLQKRFLGSDDVADAPQLLLPWELISRESAMPPSQI